MSSVTSSRRVSALFVRADSCYFSLDVDCWDAGRDARNYVADNPVIAHPPCRAWGRLRQWAKPRPDEKALALFAVDQVRRCGGVLEHPYGSSLWPVAGLPPPGGSVDAFGGWTLLVEQGWWGHDAPKPTYLYIVGVTSAWLPEIPYKLHRAAGRISDMSTADREATPLAFARWLVDLARRVQLHLPAALVTPTRAALTPAEKRAALRAWAANA